MQKSGCSFVLGYIALFVLMAVLLCTAISAEVTDAEILSSTPQPEKLTDGDYNTKIWLDGQPIKMVTGGTTSLYLVFDEVGSAFAVTDTTTGERHTFNESGFLHAFADIESVFGRALSRFEIDTMDNKILCDLYTISGDVPNWVERWEDTYERADILLFASHSDDDQLFFAGLIPLYSGEREMRVQVAHLTDHREAPVRRHELLSGLWHAGAKAYPIIPDFPDPYSESYEGAISVYNAYGIKYEDFLAYISDTVEQVKPTVIVSHDLGGEYGHGTHMLCSRAIIDSMDKITEDGVSGVGSDGLWKVSKIYFHLYGENKIELELDEPLESFGGKTAFEVSQEAFQYHKTQHWTWFKRWIHGESGAPIKRSTEIKTYSPRYYGLYYSAVGADEACRDIFENLLSLGEEEELRLAEESRLEEESIAESIRLEEESRAESIAESLREESRLEESRRESESAAESEREAMDKEAQRRRTMILILVLLAVAAVAVCFVIIDIMILKPKKRGGRNGRRSH